MQEKGKISMLIMSVTCLLVLMRTGREELHSELHSLHGLRMLITSRKQQYCNGSKLVLSQAQRNRYAKERDIMKKVQPVNPIDEYLAQKDTSKRDAGKVALAYGMLAAPFIIFFILSVLGCFCYVCCCCCDKCCPPCKCCRRDYEKNPISKCEKNFPIILLIAVSVFLIIVGIWGVVASGEMPASVTAMQCTVISIPENLMLGVAIQPTGQWIGTLPLATQLTAVSGRLLTDISDISNSLGDISFVQTDGDAIKNQINAIATNFPNKQVIRPDNQALTQAHNYMIKAGPITDNTSLTYRLDLYAYAQITAISTLLTAMKQGLNTLASSSQQQAIKDQIDAGLSQVNTLNTNLGDIHKSVYDFSNVSLEVVKQQMLNSSKIFFIFMIVVGAINSFFAALILLCTLKKIRYFLHMSWCVVGLLMILLFLLCSVMYPVSYVLFGTCEVIQTVLANEQGLNRYNLNIQSTTDKVKVCLWNGSGDIATSFGIRTQLNDLNKITSNFNGFLDKLKPGSPNYVDINQVTDQACQTEMDIITPFVSGRLAQMTADISGTGNNNPGVAINNLNLYSTQETGSKQVSGNCLLYKDLFVYDLNDCGTYTTQFNNITNSATFNTGQKTCIQVMQVGNTFMTTRYSAYCSGSCAADCATFKTLFANVQAHDNSRREAYHQYHLAVQNVKTAMQAFNAKMINKVTPLNSISVTVATFISGVIQIIDQINCVFLFQDLQNFVDAMCIAFVPAFSNMIKLIAMGCFGFYFSVFFGYLVAMRVSKMAKDEEDSNKVADVNGSHLHLNGQTQQPGYIPIQPMFQGQQASNLGMAKY